MLFSAVAVNLNKVGFTFTTDQLFLLTALPSVSGAILRVPYSFVIPLFGGRRWTAISTCFLLVPCLWLGFAVQDSSTPYSVFVIISLLCGFAGANLPPAWPTSASSSRKRVRAVRWGLTAGWEIWASALCSWSRRWRSLSACSACLAVRRKIRQRRPTVAGKRRTDLGAVPAGGHAGGWFGMNDLAAAKASLRQQLPVLKRGHLWMLSLLYLATFGSFIGFSAGFAMLSKTQFPDVVILHYAFFGPFLGALARPVGGALSDRFGGVRVTLINFVVMAVFAALLFLTLPSAGREVRSSPSTASLWCCSSPRGWAAARLSK